MPHSLRKCSVCGKLKKPILFYKRKDGFDYKCKVCKDKYNRKWFKENREKQRSYTRKSRAKTRKKAFNIIANDNPICAKVLEWNCCDPGSLNYREFLTLDHINNDGVGHRKNLKSKGGSKTYDWVIKHPTLARRMLQVLCANGQLLKVKSHNK